MEAKPHERTLEITIIFGENIRFDQGSILENMYVVTRAESLKSYTTKTTSESGGLFAWNEKFLLEIPRHARCVTFEVQCNKFKGIRPIGVARIALSNFFISDNNKNVLENGIQMFSYGLRDWDGRKNGVIHFSVNVVSNTPKDYSCFEAKATKVIETVNNSSEFENDHVMGFKVRGKQEKFKSCCNWYSNFVGF